MVRYEPFETFLKDVEGTDKNNLAYYKLLFFAVEF